MTSLALVWTLYGREQRRPLNAALLEAAARGDAAGITHWVAKGADANARSPRSVRRRRTAVTDWTALMHAVVAGKRDAVRLLLEKGAAVNARDYAGLTALMLSADPGSDVGIARMLLDHGADVNARDCNGTTALMYAASGHQLAIARSLVACGADVNARQSGGRTCLIWAAGGGDAAMVAFLLQNGADVHAKTTDGWTALESARAYGFPEIVPLLKKAGAGG